MDFEERIIIYQALFIVTNMNIKTRVVILSAILLASVILSGCVTKQEITPPPKETAISVSAEHTDRTFTLFVNATEPSPYLEAVLIQPDGEEAYEGLGEQGWVGTRNITLKGKFDGSNTVMLRNRENKNEVFYQTNWTVRLPHYRSGENIPVKGLDITFNRYAISASDSNKTSIVIPIEGENIRSVSEKRVRICIERVKLDKGYINSSVLGYEYVEFELEPKDTDINKIIFEIAKGVKLLEMHGYFKEYATFTSCDMPDAPEDRFVIELEQGK